MHSYITNKSKTQKKDLSKQMKISMSVCARCYVDIPKLSDVFDKFTSLPTVISKLIINYFELDDQRIGYVLLHKPTRRRKHILCVDCTEKHIDHALNTYIPQRRVSVSIPCPYFGCDRKIDVLNISQNLIE